MSSNTAAAPRPELVASEKTRVAAASLTERRTPDRLAVVVKSPEPAMRRPSKASGKHVPLVKQGAGSGRTGSAPTQKQDGRRRGATQLTRSQEDEELRVAVAAQRRTEREQLLSQPRECWPTVFSWPPMPLAVGIDRQLHPWLGELGASWQTLRRTLMWWTSRPAYWAALARGEIRRNLDGSQALAPSEGERQHAEKQLQQREAARQRYLAKRAKRDEPQ